MRKLSSVFAGPLALLAAVLLASGARAQVYPNDGSIVGVNLGSAEYWTGSQPFWDLMKLSTPFFLQDDAHLNLGPPPNLRSDGYPADIPAGQHAVTIMDWAGMRREVNWVLLYAGDGDIGFGGDAHVVTRTTGRITVSVDQPRRAGIGIVLRILRTNVNDPLRDFRVVPAEIAAQFDTPLAARLGFSFEPYFRKQLDSFSILRFMTWQRTNETPVVDWADRSKVDYQTWDVPAGVPPTVMTLLANQKHAKPWFNMPSAANDNFVREFARLVAQSLDPTLNVYVEEGNEVWNPVAPYNAGKNYAVAQGKIAYAGKPWTDHTFAIAWHSLRTTQVGDIWKQTFAEEGKDPNRVITVYGAQGSADFTALFGLSLDSHYQKIDAVAIAVYLGLKLVETTPDLLQKTPDQVVDLLFNEIPSVMTKVVVPHVRDVSYYQNALHKPIKLIAYEGGVFLKPYQGTAYQNLFQQVSRNPRMEQLFSSLLQTWNSYTAGVDPAGAPFLIFNDVSNYQVTVEGLRESQYQTIDSAPKMKGVSDYIEFHR
jgi:hypothetical protein